jgi:GNAT superfamily N-acetyltransferase
MQNSRCFLSQGCAVNSDITIEQLTETLPEKDLVRLAELHAARLSEQFLTMMGRRYLCAFYRFIASSPLETLFISRKNGLICGVCALTQAENTVLRRSVMSTFLDFVRAAGTRFLLSPPFRRACFAIAKGGNRLVYKPQILLLFTDSSTKGIGSLLIKYVASTLQGADFLYTKTETDNIEAIAFYQRMGFEIVERVIYAERTYYYLRMPIFR